MGQLSEGTPATPGQLVSLRSNIMWNPELVSRPAHFLKVQDVSQSATPVADICSPSGCDYNDGFNNDEVNTTDCHLGDCSVLTNQGNGYGAKFISHARRSRHCG